MHFCADISQFVAAMLRILATSFLFHLLASFLSLSLSLCVGFLASALLARSFSEWVSAYSATSFSSIEILYLECSRNAVRATTIGIRYNYSRFKSNATIFIKWRRIALLLWDIFEPLIIGLSIAIFYVPLFDLTWIFHFFLHFYGNSNLFAAANHLNSFPLTSHLNGFLFGFEFYLIFSLWFFIVETASPLSVIQFSKLFPFSR